MSAREQETSEDIETVHADMHGNEAIRYTSCMVNYFFNNTKIEGLCAKWHLDISLIFQCMQNCDFFFLWGGEVRNTYA